MQPGWPPVDLPSFVDDTFVDLSVLTDSTLWISPVFALYILQLFDCCAIANAVATFADEMIAAQTRLEGDKVVSPPGRLRCELKPKTDEELEKSKLSCLAKRRKLKLNTPESVSAVTGQKRSKKYAYYSAAAPILVLPTEWVVLVSCGVASLGTAFLGATPVIVFGESFAGVQAGGRTGLTAIFMASFFFLTWPLYPVLTAVPLFASAPILVKLGASLIHLIKFLNFDDTLQGVPSFLTISLMPLLSSIDKAMEIGIASWILLQLMKMIDVKLGEACKPRDGKDPCNGSTVLYATIGTFVVASASAGAWYGLATLVSDGIVHEAKASAAGGH